MRHQIKKSLWLLLLLTLMHVVLGSTTTRAQQAPANGQVPAIVNSQPTGIISGQASTTTNNQPASINGQPAATTSSKTTATTIGQPPAGMGSQGSATIKIGPGDLLEISVFDVPEMTQQARVGADGRVKLQLLGNTAVGGLTAPEAAERIASELRERKLLLQPQVNVLVREFASQGVSVTGEVQHPGVYQVLGPRSLLDIISMAGGLTNVADTRITVKRRSGPEKRLMVRLKSDDPDSSLSNNVEVYPGDLVVVPRAGIVYVLGDVNRPGGFVMQDSGKITLLQALAQAGGASKSASLSKAVLMRKDGQGYSTSKLHVGKIQKGEEPDFELQANDILFVPNNRLKNAMTGTQAVISTLGSASIYAAVH